MLTLFHHSLPAWSAATGGLTHPRFVADFAAFAHAVVEALGDLVDFWLPFNEPTVFAGLTYCAGVWPPGFPPLPPLRSAACLAAPMGLGAYSAAMGNVAAAHRAAFRAIKRAHPTAPVGTAHNVAYMSPAGVFDVLPSVVSDRLMVMPFVTAIAASLDFVGLNYYGQEFMAGFGQVRNLTISILQSNALIPRLLFWPRRSTPTPAAPSSRMASTTCSQPSTAASHPCRWW